MCSLCTICARFQHFAHEFHRRRRTLALQFASERVEEKRGLIVMNKTLEDNPMDQDVFAGHWKQMRDALKAWWGKLADSDFDRIGGQTDKLIGALQEKYGYVRAQAQHEVEQRMKEYGDTLRGPDG